MHVTLSPTLPIRLRCSLNRSDSWFADVGHVFNQEVLVLNFAQSLLFQTKDGSLDKLLHYKNRKVKKRTPIRPRE